MNTEEYVEFVRTRWEAGAPADADKRRKSEERLGVLLEPVTRISVVTLPRIVWAVFDLASDNEEGKKIAASAVEEAYIGVATQAFRTLGFGLFELACAKALHDKAKEEE